jgi:hypothetical protein
MLRWQEAHLTYDIYSLWDDYLYCIAALSNAAPAIYFSGALRKHIIWADY